MSGFVALTNENYKLPLGTYDTREASKFTGVPIKTLEVWRTASDPKLRAMGPPWHKANGWRVYYIVAELREWMLANAAVLQAEADKLRARADTAVRTAEAELRPGFMPRQSPAAGFVDASSTPNPAEDRASELRVKNAQAPSPEPLSAEDQAELDRLAGKVTP